MRIQGHYRVSLNGFRCSNAIWDDALNRDSFADEVFFHVELRYLDITSNMTEETVRRVTKTIGSGGDGRYVFCSGRNIFREHRGITSGDEFPGPELYPNPQDAPSLEMLEGDHTDYWGTQGHPRKFRFHYANLLGTRSGRSRFTKLRSYLARKPARL